MFLDVYRRAALAALETCPVWVVCLQSDPDQVFAWTCAEPDRGLLHFLYTKSKFRRMGFASRLLSEVRAESDDVLTTTAWTDDMDRLKTNHLNGCNPGLFNPRGKQ